MSASVKVITMMPWFRIVFIMSKFLIKMIMH
jgi:hypothetical protein